jgi:hypothetical protein
MIKGVLSKQLSIRVGNEVGTLAQITSLISSYRINMVAICAYAVDNRCSVTMVTENNIHAKRLLKEKGYDVEEQDVALISVSNEPGSLHQITEKISAAGVDLKLIYGSVEKHGKTSRIVFVPSENPKKLLQALKIKIK